MDMRELSGLMVKWCLRNLLGATAATVIIVGGVLLLAVAREIEIFSHHDLSAAGVALGITSSYLLLRIIWSERRSP